MASCLLGGECTDASRAVGTNAHLVGLILEIAPICCFVLKKGEKLGDSHCAEKLELYVRNMTCIMN